MMSFYEVTFIVRQDVSSAQVQNVSQSVVALVEAAGGSVIKSEYWGLRSLAYPINKNHRGHYMFLGVQVHSKALPEIDHLLRYEDSVLRTMTVRVEHMSNDPTPVMQAKEGIDVAPAA